MTQSSAAAAGHPDRGDGDDLLQGQDGRDILIGGEWPG